ncbi:MAG: alpha-N-arabinofuranosidase [Gemmatimonadota bacterium]|nr:MAG: alpha-N-arabinofuranosidase [Gemmatimonadota bacterium]
MHTMSALRAAACGSLALILASSAVHAQAVPVSIDTRAVGEPISPYIYGQFIEHLGRCIYGGLWAEMLEDRKFFYPVTGDAPAWEMFKPGPRSWDGEGHPYELLMRSPWMIIGDKSAVSMVSESSYAGEHTPHIKLPGDSRPGGLMQERLALIGGRHYTGRIVLAGDPGAAPIAVSLVWGSGASDRHTVMVSDIGASWVTVPLEFVAGGSTDNGRLEIVGTGEGSLMLGTVSLMPADNMLGWRAETVALLRQLNAPIYRWPGGNFVSGYDWKDGIGDPDRRPPRKNPAWKGIEHNDVGIHEFMDLMRLIDAEPFIAVNTGLGSAEAAAEQVEYVNGGTDTPMGRLRADNGHPVPFGVEWFAVGNEMYGEWQLGHMPLSEYVLKHNRVVEAMRAVDPSVRLVGVGAAGEWSRQMLTSSADHMELISEHLYWQDRDDVLEHVDQMRTQINRVADAHRAYRSEIPGLADKDIRIAMDEWNYWYGAYEYGELGVQYFLQDALGIAAGLHTFFRNSDLYYMANYAQTVNVIGAIKTTKTNAELETTGLVLQLYRNHFGTHPVQVSNSDASLDVSAAMSDDNTTLTVAVINPLEESRELDLSIVGRVLTGRGSRRTLTGTNRWSHNMPGQPREVDIHQTSFTSASNVITVAPLSVTLFAFGVQ